MPRHLLHPERTCLFRLKNAIMTLGDSGGGGTSSLQIASRSGLCRVLMTTGTTVPGHYYNMPVQSLELLVQLKRLPLVNPYSAMRQLSVQLRR
jgi:hypothetical protein